MSRARAVRLTEKESDALLALLGMVLTNSDQWDFMDLRALERAHRKIEEA